MIGTGRHRKNWYRRIACAIFLLAAFALPAVAQDRLSGESLVEALRQGGYVIYFRHAATDWSQDDHLTAEGEWTSCDPARMRQLSDQGRTQARRIGEAIRRLKIPVGRMLSSEYCRARQTAELMDLGPVKPTVDIMNMRAAHLVGGRETVVDRARTQLGRLPDNDTNTVLVGHGNLMRAATGAYTGEAGAGVFEPLGDGNFQLVAQVAPDQWTQLAEKFGR
jgi:phosphohistidine phosphatase SixA